MYRQRLVAAAGYCLQGGYHFFSDCSAAAVVVADVVAVEVEAVLVVETVAERLAGTQADCSTSCRQPAAATLVRRTAAAVAADCTVDYCSSSYFAAHRMRRLSAVEHVATVHRCDPLPGNSFHPGSFSYCFFCLRVLDRRRRRDWNYCHLGSKIAAVAASVVDFLHSRCPGGASHP